MFEVNTLVVSEYATVLSEVPATVNETLSPADTLPKEPAEVVNDGAVDAVIILFVLLPALPSCFLLLHNSYLMLKLH